MERLTGEKERLRWELDMLDMSHGRGRSTTHGRFGSRSGLGLLGLG